MRFSIAAVAFAMVATISAYPQGHEARSPDGNVVRMPIKDPNEPLLLCSSGEAPPEKSVTLAYDFIKMIGAGESPQAVGGPYKVWEARFTTAGPKGCTTVYCYDETRVVWCNPKNEARTIGRTDIAKGVKRVLDHCVRKESKDVAGHLIYQDRWKMDVTRDEKC
ncbi:hypothetical protein BDW69DRAFT_190291 [Aspergillus filifer]